VKKISAKTDWSVKIGLFLVALFWFSFTFYEFIVAIIGRAIVWPIIMTDLPATVGLGFRAAAGFIVVIAILFYVAKRDLSRPEATMSARWAVILEAGYFVSLVPSGVWGMVTSLGGMYSRVFFIVETGLPCLLEGIAIPSVLAKLFLELTPKKSARTATKWALISGTVYLFVYWFNYTSQWIAEMMLSGIAFLSLYPVNAFGFAITAIGLLLLALFAAYFSRRSFGKEVLTKPDLKRIGVIVTALGLYFDLSLLLWILFGGVGGGSVWYTFFVYHNMELWCLALPLAGVPLLLKNGH
jgi:hypothetical protein